MLWNLNKMPHKFLLIMCVLMSQCLSLLVSCLLPVVYCFSQQCAAVMPTIGCSAGRRVETGWFGRKKRTVAIADAVTLGDSWLGPAIKAGYLQPLQDVTGYRWWVSNTHTQSICDVFYSTVYSHTTFE